VVLESFVVGFPVSFQHTPLTVTPVVQLPDTVPPEEAVVAVIEEAAVVETVGSIEFVVNETWLP
jgi:hypothetical protein